VRSRYNTRVEPPSSGLEAASLIASLPSLLRLSELWQVSAGFGFLFLSTLFSIVLGAISKRYMESPGSDYKPLGALASVQFGRSLTAFAYVVSLTPPLYDMFDRLLRITPPYLDALFALTIVAILYVIFVLQMGRLVAEARLERVLQISKYPLQFWQWFSYPVWRPVVWASNLLKRSLITLPSSLSQSEMIKRLLDEEETKENPAQKQERELLRNVLDFSEIIASEMMVPRPDVRWIDVNAPLAKVIEQITQSGHTRFPLCEGTPDKVIGYLHAKDIAFLQNDYLPAGVDLRKLARPVMFVPESVKAMNLLERFQKAKIHFAVVVDEFGSMAGIVTLEDLLEELVGDIQDEFDVEETEVRSLESGEVLVDGSVHLEDLEQDLGISFGDVEEETLGGFIFGRLARSVQAGDVVEIEGATLQVEVVEGLRVTRVRIIPKKRVLEFSSVS
jgi:CBS domain containing-hemolysin-like protein